MAVYGILKGENFISVEWNESYVKNYIEPRILGVIDERSFFIEKFQFFGF
jgi:hypothetical protein